MRTLLFRYATATHTYILDIHIYKCCISVAERCKALRIVAYATVIRRCMRCMRNGQNATLKILIISNLKHIVASCRGMQQTQRMDKAISIRYVVAPLELSLRSWFRFLPALEFFYYKLLCGCRNRRNIIN